MIIDNRDLEALLERISLLPPEYRVRLMHGILETLIPSPLKKTETLQFGEFRDFDGPFSTIEDYVIAEWRPSERELSGE
ncbi:MAG TPA: hypothetical protein PK205_05960 [Promineifilum sp.]|nr:hypothetical protein [Promineifilum sp.]HRO25434.1 hypothetical protein [Promineifilum sp.]HRO89940.1 hypothetical protein [Promineifilum sp.]HRQ12834.1 hypothetical protein [Promineifilum sp.]